MRVNLCVFNLLIINSLFFPSQSVFPEILSKSNPSPICGTPQLWNKPVDVVFFRYLAKPVEGDTTFWIREDIFSSENNLIELSFYRLFENDTIAIFVEVDEFDGGRVNQSDVDNVAMALLYRTPDGSINPEKGILTNEIEIFGELPDVDRNGKLFVLLIDVRDGYSEGESETYVSGYFDPLDQYSGKGNYSDIIYVDTNPAKTDDERTLSVLAHELQHLIHYGKDKDEEIWLNEGLSELAPHLLGLPSRSFASFLNDTNRPLNDFDDSITDYAKVGLWSFYYYRQFGIRMIKPIVQEEMNSLQSYEKVLQDSGYSINTKDELLKNWFIANLINEPFLGDGRYGYDGASIPKISSEYFSSNFTSGENITIELNRAAAEYVQFYSGSDLTFEMKHSGESKFGLVAVKHYSSPELEIAKPCPEVFEFNDPQFGISYKKITFIPYRTYLASGNEYYHISYSASGKGGYEEEELVYDQDSLDFYIQLVNYEAAEKFSMPSSDAILAAVKFKVENDDPVAINVYSSLESTPIAIYQDVIPNSASWTRFDFEEDIFPEEMKSFFLSVSGEENSLGYSETNKGQGRAYLKTGTIFRDLTDFKVGDDKLTGDWLIRAIVKTPIIQPPALIIKPDSIYFWNGEYQSSFSIKNAGTEELEWSIIDCYPEWLSFDPQEGMTLDESNVQINIDRNILLPGLYKISVPIFSNGGNDTLFISVLERNIEQPQAALLPTRLIFSNVIGRMVLRVFNIGLGNSEFGLFPLDPSLNFYPPAGAVDQDTIWVDAFLDREVVRSGEILAKFFNGIDTTIISFIYKGDTISVDKRLKIFAPVQNPFVVSKQVYTTIQVRLESNKKPSLKIYNILGQEVKSFKFKNYNAGLHLFRWYGKNSMGHWVSSAIYFVILQQNGEIAKQKILLLK